MDIGYKELKFCGFKFKYVLGFNKDFDPDNFEYIDYIYDGCYLYGDSNGLKAVVVKESVPIFDSGDREWDSYKHLYLIPKNGKVIGYLVRGGYRVASVEYFSDIQWGDEYTQKIMEKKEIFK